MSLTIKTSFVVAQPPAEVWPALVDIETSAPCFPGAQLNERLPDGSYSGLFTVKLGPMTFVFKGRFRLVQQDDQARTAVMEADGTDSKGRGGARAQVQVAVSDAGTAGSDVAVVSDVTLSGAVAQYGRGVAMIEALSRQLLAQFSKNLSEKISSMGATVASAEMPVAAASANDAAPAASAAPAAPAAEHAATSQPVFVRSAPAAPLDAGTLVRDALWISIKRFFARLFGPPQRP